MFGKRFDSLLFILGLLGLLVLSGCGDLGGDNAPVTPRGASAPRSLGKADGLYSCKGFCGKKAPGGCWCDEQCAKFGDCCKDKSDSCDQTQGSCVGSCGKKSPDGCYCDAACAKYGDCCKDKVKACAAPTGCKTDLECAANQYCASSKGCGGSGTCAVRPQFCIELYKPVCGCDGKTYGNDCFAASAGTRVASEGKCDPTGTFCGGIAGILCPAGYECKLDGNYPDAGGKCVKAAPPKPTCFVGGCSGQVCGSKQGIVTTCEWLPHYACFKQSSCGAHGPGGTCGWAKTPGFVACMKNAGKGVL